MLTPQLHSQSSPSERRVPRDGGGGGREGEEKKEGDQGKIRESERGTHKVGRCLDEHKVSTRATGYKTEKRFKIGGKAPREFEKRGPEDTKKGGGSDLQRAGFKESLWFKLVR